MATWQGASLCQPAVRVDRGTSSSLPPLSGGIVRGRDAPESGCIIRGLLVETGIKDGHFTAESLWVAAEAGGAEKASLEEVGGERIFLWGKGGSIG